MTTSSKPESRKLPELVGVRLGTEEHEQARLIAEREGVTVQALLRSMLRDRIRGASAV